ncbi:MASE4 domain-containing protein [Mesorhizobium sp. IMUNJ 23232]|uniref:MASE4 domain-containing protein n=1 Tax=Mesorhizobium sp. IMUNJ 23232 TaxID=3376064 RepID=UPI00378FD4B4
MAAYNAISTCNDFTTAIILFGHFNFLRSRALLLLASGYLFAALISVIQLLTFPGAFGSAGLFGATPQTALWLCIFWHGGFPLIVIFYALFHTNSREISMAPRFAIAAAVIGAVGVVLVCWFVATWGTGSAGFLPPLLDADGFTPWQRIINLIDIILVIAALVMLSTRSRPTLPNLWLMVVMVYWFCDITLSSYLNGGRYDFGFYAGRTYGAFAASFVLAVVVLENGRLYRRLAAAASHLKEHATELLQTNETLQSEITNRLQIEEDLRRAQAELARVSRMNSMGELTSSLADEVNHPIGAIMINAETCRRWLSDETPNVERARAIADRIVEDGSRASRTVARMKQLFDKGGPLRDIVDVNDVIREMTVLLGGEAARYGVSIRTEQVEKPSPVTGDRAQLMQVLMHLMINAIEAMKEKDDGRDLLIRSQEREDGRVTVSVSDTGVGLPQLPPDQIFKAFFTTKPSSIGIGLSISRSIVEEHGGHLWAATNLSGGADFSFSLPIAPQYQ